MREDSARFPLSTVWLQVAVLTFLFGFAVLGYLAYRISWDQPPIPVRVVDEQGGTVFTGEDILAGQRVFQKYGLMQHGSIFGHGAYLGPDFTAQYLHYSSEEILNRASGGTSPSPEASAALAEELKKNRYDPGTGSLTFSGEQVQAYYWMVEFYGRYFGARREEGGLQPPVHPAWRRGVKRTGPV